MLLIPKNVGKLSELAATEVGKFSLTGVLLEQPAEGQYRAVATNGKILGMVEGQGECFDLFPKLAALSAAPNGATEALVPASAWKEGFALVPKKTGTSRGMKPVLFNLAVVLGQKETTFGATDMERGRSLVTRNVEGRFPDYRGIFESLEEKPVQATVKLNTGLLRDLLAVAEQFCPDDNQSVTLEVRGKDDAVVVKTANVQQKFSGIIMPLS